MSKVGTYLVPYKHRWWSVSGVARASRVVSNGSAARKLLFQFGDGTTEDFGTFGDGPNSLIFHE